MVLLFTLSSHLYGVTNRKPNHFQENPMTPTKKSRKMTPKRRLATAVITATLSIGAVGAVMLTGANAAAGWGNRATTSSGNS